MVQQPIRSCCATGFPRFCLVALIAFCCLGTAAAPPGSPSTVVAPTLLTNLFHLWSIEGEAARLPHRIQAEFLVYYSDPVWNVTFGESHGEPGYLPLGRGAPKFQHGQQIRVDGLALPSEQRILWDQTGYEIVGRSSPPTPISLNDLDSAERQQVSGRWVTLQGLADVEEDRGGGHLAIRLLVGSSVVTLQLLRDSSHPALPKFPERLVKVSGVYVRRDNTVGGLEEADLWTPGADHLEFIGSLSSDPRFDLPVTAANQLALCVSNTVVHVRGEVRRQERGREDGLLVLSQSSDPLFPGDTVDVVGFRGCEGHRLVLREAPPADPKPTRRATA